MEEKILGLFFIVFGISSIIFRAKFAHYAKKWRARSVILEGPSEQFYLVAYLIAGIISAVLGIL